MQLAEELRARGARVTQPRQVVWDVLCEGGGHLSAAELAERVRTRDPGVNVSSVYRTLALFAELGLVRESRSGDDTASTWELRHPDGVIHLVCSRCGTVAHHRTDRVEQLAADIARKGDFVPEAIDVRVTGLCADCAD